MDLFHALQNTFEKRKNAYFIDLDQFISTSNISKLKIKSTLELKKLKNNELLEN